jgi:type VI secretion system protein ImpB
MAEGSVAPKERVNIKYKPATGGAQEEVELPLKLLMVGDYMLRQDDTPLEDRKKINIDKDNFNEVMRALGLRLELNVPNRLSGQEKDEMPVHLEVETLNDFRPENVVEKVPELQKLRDLREALAALRGPLGGNAPEFRRKIQTLLASESARERLLKELNLADTEG